jgi:hypothetical protein
MDAMERKAFLNQVDLAELRHRSEQALVENMKGNCVFSSDGITPT